MGHASAIWTLCVVCASDEVFVLGCRLKAEFLLSHSASARAHARCLGISEHDVRARSTTKFLGCPLPGDRFRGTSWFSGRVPPQRRCPHYNKRTLYSLPAAIGNPPEIRRVRPLPGLLFSAERVINRSLLEEEAPRLRSRQYSWPAPYPLIRSRPRARRHDYVRAIWRM